jgi:replication-associated recombination protein RarA
MSVPHHSADPWTRVRTLHDFPADEVISAFQKEIRRSHTENAALLAYEMMLTGPELEEFMWVRLQVISIEDIGFANLNAPLIIDTLYRMRQQFPHGVADRYLFGIHAVRVLCSSEKDRSTAELFDWLDHAVNQEGKRPEIPDYAIDMHTRRGQEAGRDMAHYLREAAKMEPELASRDTTYLDRLKAALDIKG